MTASPAAAVRRPGDFREDVSILRTPAPASSSSVDRLLTDIAYQWQRERQRIIRRPGQRCFGNGQQDPMTTSMTEGPISAIPEPDGRNNYNNDENYDEAASAYWWTDMFLRYFVFDEENDDCNKPTAAADSDDLLFFVRRRRRRRQQKRDERRRCKRLPLTTKQPQRIAYDTRAYRKQQHQRQQHQQPALLPIGDPAVLWRHTVCLNAIVHRFRYTLTVAVCVHVPRKTTTTGVDFYCNDGSEDFGLDDGPEQEYDLQLLSRHVHTVYASTSGRRMDAEKGPRERPVYPAVCWAVDDYTEAFRTVIVRPGQTVCAELVATWPGSAIVEERVSGGEDYDGEYAEDYNEVCDQNQDPKSPVDFCRESTNSVSPPRRKQNRAVLFSAAVPYAAVRAAYECKMSLYREAERQRRKRCKRVGSKKSSLGAALSASLTALFASGKDLSTTARFSDCNEYDYYYGTSSNNTAERIEYVTVRGCQMGCDDERFSLDDEIDCRDDLDEISTGSNSYDDTKGLAQMAVTLAPVLPTEETDWSSHENDGEYHRKHFNNGKEYCDNITHDYDHNGGDDDGANDDYRQQRQVEPPSPYAASDPGDYYDYGWDYETTTGSGHHTPQTPSYRHRQQQRRQVYRQQRCRQRRLSDPCSTTVYDLLYNNGGVSDGLQYQYFYQQYMTNNNSKYGSGSYQKQQYNKQQYKTNSFGIGERSSTAATPEKLGITLYSHRACSENEGLDICGKGGAVQQKIQQKHLLLPPPPVPYYCAAEAAASGFIQFVHKSPSGWWIRAKNRRKKHRSRSKKQQRNKTTTITNRYRSASVGGIGNNSSCCTTDDDDSNGSGSGSGSNSDDGGSNSDEQDSDGEFIGALAAAAAIGHDPNREWAWQGATGDPVADWERYNSDSTDSTETVTVNDTVEWTTEILATDLRHGFHYQNETIVTEPVRSIIVNENDLNLYGKSSQLSSAAMYTNQHQQQQQYGLTGNQHQRHRRPPPPQFRPQPLEPPPIPPALSVAFTAVACPWWTVLEDVLLVTTATTTLGRTSSSNKSVPGSPLLTFD